MKAAQTVEELHSVKRKPREEDRKRSRRNYIVVKQACNICHGHQAVRSCERSNAMIVDDRKKNAKEKTLSFRCLADNGKGKDRRRAKEWAEESIRRKSKPSSSCRRGILEF